uniref:transmembrane channel-like protein 5 n=1 Tax=Pristiophorus japonicus TaxID=55135 RepID=UPI00398EECA7
MNHQEADEGFANYAYHHSETLEIDRSARGRSSTYRTTPLHSPYQQGRFDSPDVQRRWAQPEVIPMASIEREYSVSRLPSSNMNPYEHETGHVNPGFEPLADDSYSSASSAYDGYSHRDTSFIPGIHRNAETSNEEPATTKRRRTIGISLRLASLAGITASQYSFPEEELSTEETEDEIQLIEELAKLTPNERAKAIQQLTMSMDEKRAIRDHVEQEIGPLATIAEDKINCCTQLLYNILFSLRRFRENMFECFQSVHPWQRSLKIIGGKFGTSVLSYFTFLKWLFMFNIYSFMINFSFIAFPQFFAFSHNNLTFTGLELLTGSGYFSETVFYYGFYTNTSIRTSPGAEAYNMQLAYFLTIGIYMMICFLSLVYSMAKTFNENFIAIGIMSGDAARLLCSWDFNITNEITIQLKKRSLGTQLKEMLSDKLHFKRQLSTKQRIVRFLVHLLGWIVSLGTTFGCCFGIYSYSISNFEIIELDPTEEDLQKQAATLLLPFVLAIINLFIPLFFSFLGAMERFKYPRHELYVLIIRNVLLKMSLIGVLCYYWLMKVASNVECWETFVGQDLYRLVVIDFIFSLLGSFFGEFIRSIMGTHCCRKLGLPEFDIARNVLGLIYAQTLAWIGLFFAPLLPAIQIIKFFIIFHVKKVSLMMNCQPPRQAWRASHMTTIFIFLLFFPGFLGVLCLLGVTVWRLKPSKICGPFRGLNVPYSAISHFIYAIQGKIHNLSWLVWGYKNLILNPLFFFILTVIVLAIIYLYLQIIDGRKMMVKLLHEHIVNEGKDKAYLLQKINILKGKVYSSKERLHTLRFASEFSFTLGTTFSLPLKLDLAEEKHCFCIFPVIFELDVGSEAMPDHAARLVVISVSHFGGFTLDISTVIALITTMNDADPETKPYWYYKPCLQALALIIFQPPDTWLQVMKAGICRTNYLDKELLRATVRCFRGMLMKDLTIIDNIIQSLIRSLRQEEGPTTKNKNEGIMVVAGIPSIALHDALSVVAHQLDIEGVESLPVAVHLQIEMWHPQGNETEVFAKSILSFALNNSGLDEDSWSINSTEERDMVSEHETEEQRHYASTREDAGNALALALAARHQAEQGPF